MIHYVGGNKISHRNGEITMTCCECDEKQRHPGHQWTPDRIGGDSYALVCPDCAAKWQESNETDEN